MIKYVVQDFYYFYFTLNYLNSSKFSIVCFYFKKCYCKSVYDGWQPLLVSKRHKSYIYGGNDEVETMYLVPEFCNLTGISDSMR